MDLYTKKQMDHEQNTVAALLYDWHEYLEAAKHRKTMQANIHTLRVTLTESAERCRAAILWHAEHGTGILNAENLKHRVALQLDVMQIQGLISDEVFTAAQEDVYSDDCEICGERKFSTVEREILEGTSTDRGWCHFYTKYMMCESCADQIPAARER